MNMLHLTWIILGISWLILIPTWVFILKSRRLVKQTRQALNNHNRWVSTGPKLLEACKAQHNAIDRLFAELIERDPEFFPSKSGQPWEAIQKGNAAIAEAEE